MSEYGSATVEPEHLLLGLIREGQGRAVELLRDSFQLEMVALTIEVTSGMERKPAFPTAIEVPFGASAERVLIATADEADRLSDRAIRPEHLLLGLLRVADTIPAMILAKHGVTFESVRAHLRPPSP